MTDKHTPGPWKVTIDGIGCREIKGNKGGASRQAQYRTPVAGTVGLSNDEEDRANARLIAAAPELLKVLEEIAETYHGTVYIAECGRGYPPSHKGLFTDCVEDRCIRARAAIKAAKGDA